MKKILSVFVYVIFFILIYIMCVCFDLISQNVKNTFELCINSVIPTLFPFFILAELMIIYMNNYPPDKIAVIYEKIFKFDKCTLSVFTAGLISGYPVGAYMVENLYSKNLISKNDAKDLICFTNNSGPLFIICTVGIGILKNIKYGITLYIIHFISAVITGITISFTRNKIYGHNYITDKIKVDISGLIENSFFKCIKICGFIIFFSVVTSYICILFYKFKTIYIAASVITEITNGIKIVSAYCNITYSMCIISFALSFSGISVILQIKSVCHGKIPLKKYILFKIYNGCISYLICALYYKQSFNLIYVLCCAYVIITLSYTVFFKHIRICSIVLNQITKQKKKVRI